MISMTAGQLAGERMRFAWNQFTLNLIEGSAEEVTRHILLGRAVITVVKYLKICQGRR